MSAAEKRFTARSRAEVYQAVGALIHMCGLSDEPDAIRILDMLAFGATQDGTPLLPWPQSDALQARMMASVEPPPKPVQEALL